MADYSELLTWQFKSNEAWKALAEVINEIYDIQIDSPRGQLALIRDPHSIERVLKAYTLKMLGLNVKSQLFSDVDLDRTLDSLSQYWKESGGSGPDFLNYIGYIKNVRLRMVELFTEDYVHFYEEPLGDLIGEDPNGTWYATTHVGMYYDGFLYELDEDQLRKLFYTFAPIQLVLAWIAEIFDFGKIHLYIAGVVYEPPEKVSFHYLYPYNGVIYSGAILHENERFTLALNPAMGTNLTIVGHMAEYEQYILRFRQQFRTILYYYMTCFDYERWIVQTNPLPRTGQNVIVGNRVQDSLISQPQT